MLQGGARLLMLLHVTPDLAQDCQGGKSQGEGSRGAAPGHGEGCAGGARSRAGSRSPAVPQGFAALRDGAVLPPPQRGQSCLSQHASGPAPPRPQPILRIPTMAGGFFFPCFSLSITSWLWLRAGEGPRCPGSCRMGYPALSRGKQQPRGGKCPAQGSELPPAACGKRRSWITQARLRKAPEAAVAPRG